MVSERKLRKFFKGWKPVQEIAVAEGMVLFKRAIDLLTVETNRLGGAEVFVTGDWPELPSPATLLDMETPRCTEGEGAITSPSFFPPHVDRLSNRNTREGRLLATSKAETMH